MRKCTILVVMLINIFFHQESFGALPPDVDLEQMTQDYVLEVRQLHIPGYPTACNASVVRWQDRLILSFNAYSVGREDQPDLMGLATLDEDFNVTGTPQILDVPKNLWQDARLVVLNDALYLLFNGAIDGGTRRMFLTKTHFNGREFSVEPPKPFLHFPGENPTIWERNWIPFVYDHSLLFATRLLPHKILRPVLENHTCEEIVSSEFSCSWCWGAVRTGTTAYLERIIDTDKQL